MIERIKRFKSYLVHWFVVSVWIVGGPSVFWYSGLGVAKTTFSVQCVLWERNCDLAWTPKQKQQRIVVDIPGYERDEIAEEWAEPVRRK